MELPEVFGDWKVTVFDGGGLALDGGSMFGSVPRGLWERLIEPDVRHRIPLAARLLILDHAPTGARVLVDTGVGDKEDDKFRDRFAVRDPKSPGAADEPSLRRGLRQVGIDPDSITHVLLTHLHFDHAGGVSYRRDTGEVVPTFPDAIHWLQRKNLETAHDPNPREKASYFGDNINPLEEVDLKLLDGDEELLPGLSVTPSHGHTDGMQTVRVGGAADGPPGSALYYLADLAPTQHHVRLPFTMGYDLCPRQIMREKEALFGRAFDEQAWLVFEHDPVRAAGQLVEHQGELRLQ